VEQHKAPTLDLPLKSAPPKMKAMHHEPRALRPNVFHR
jgi:hypothetical protein